jgi:hypothetical protein
VPKLPYKARPLTLAWLAVSVMYLKMAGNRVKYIEMHVEEATVTPLKTLFRHL